MKKTLIALVALSGMTTAYAESAAYSEMSADLQEQTALAWDFSKGGSLVANNGVTSTNGTLLTTAFTTTDHGTANLKGSGLWTSTLSGIGNDFTVSFDLATSSSPSGNWQAFMGLVSSGKNNYFDGTMQIGYNQANGAISVQNGLGAQAGFGNNEDATLSSGLTQVKLAEKQLTAPVTFTLVSSATAGTLTLYVDGEQVAQQSDWTEHEGYNLDLTGIQFGGCFGNTDVLGSDHEVSHITIFKSALTADQVQSLCTPEPATATLSLLALAGLAARRRRH